MFRTVSLRHAIRLVLAPVRNRLLLAITAAGVGGICGVLEFWLLSMALSEVLTPRPDAGRTAGWIGAALAVVLVRFALRTISFRVSHVASYDLENVLRQRLTDHLATIPIGKVQLLGSGTVKKIVHDDVRALHGLVADATPLAAVGAVVPVAAVIVMALSDWRLLLAALAAVPVAALTIWLTGRDHPGRRRRYDEANEAVNAAVVEFAQGMPVVRAFDDSTTTFVRFQHRVSEFTAAIREWNATSRNPALLTRTAIAPLPTLLAIVLVGSWLTAYGTLELATFVLFLLIGTAIVEAVTPLMWLGHYLAAAKAAALRIAGLLAIPSMPAPTTPRLPRDGSIRLRDVHFGYGELGGYDESGESVLHGVDLDVPAGTVCALVGPSGAGKSTIARLIPRFWDVDHGSVRVGGVDVREADPASLLRHLALVFQEPFLMADTVAANIRLGNPAVTDLAVTAAAKVARAHDFIVDELPDGYDTHVGEGGNRLSGGQRQRIALARAILADAPIVILDEATAFADPENAMQIQDAIADLARGKTLVVIAHRLSSIVSADQIVVLDNGRVVERGTHTELLEAAGTYALLWRHSEQARNWTLHRDGIRGGSRDGIRGGT